ncbi:hypothetical protein J6590_021259 [Homalodisca vitripennis]|nr:hypothetical protein J6590_021259 [Homalodisca vitripennis]
MSFTVEKTKTGKPCILFKYRQQRIIKNGEVSWRCLGKSCGASIKTDAGMTKVITYNQKHSGEHPVTMRTLLSPLLKSQSATAALPAVHSTPVTPPVLDCCRTPVCSTPALDLSLSDDPPGTTEQRDINNKISEDPVAEISRLRKEIDRLDSEYQTLLNHTIQSDTRLLEFTDHIFQVNASRVDQSARASATVDCGVQCEPSPIAADFGTQCDLSEQSVACARCAGNTEIICCMKTTIEVLEAENQCLKHHQTSCKVSNFKSEQKWTKVKIKNKNNKRNKQTFPIPIHNKFQILSHEKQIPPNHQSNKTSQNVKTDNFTSVIIRGDSHARHIAGLVSDLTAPGISVDGVCLPGAKLLDVLNSDQTSPRPGTRCEVLIAGTNDLAVGKQQNIYRHLETYITSRSKDTEIVLTTLPHRHDLKPNHPIHDETELVNAYIEELAIRHNIRVINFNDIGRGYFTRHGQHLSMRGKRLLARMIVGGLVLSGSACTRLETRSPPPLLVTAPAVGRLTPHLADACCYPR